jgi:iron-sulfur cluster assembly protein
MATRNNIITVTEKAQERIRNLLQDRGKDSKGIRIGVNTKGCSGLSYFIEYVDEVNAGDETVAVGDMSIFIEPKAVLFLLGTEMDFEETKMQSGFVFNNPNEKGRCGCGKSFHV